MPSPLGVHEGAGGGEFFAGFQPGLEAGEDHPPAAVELVVGALAQVAVGDGEVAGIAYRFELQVTREVLPLPGPGA